MSIDNAYGDCLTISLAAEKLGLGVSQARAVLQSPDKVILNASGKVQHLYSSTRVELLAQKRESEKGEKQKLKHTRCCYWCKRRFKEEQLTSNLCPDCQAYKWIRNFAHHGDCVFNPVDFERIEAIERAFRRFRNHLSKGRAKAI